METPVLLIVFNRIDTTIRVFEQIRKIKPKRFYISCDGPRLNSVEDSIKVKQVRDYILKNIDWDCNVSTLFREENIGCKEAVSSAISWMFESEDRGIILEDDCLPHLDFFTFCDELLEKYKDCQTIGLITGNNFQDGIQRGEFGYYFSKYNHIWGWATWKRAWLKYSGDLSFIDEWLTTESWKELNNSFFERRYWENIFKKVNSGQISTAWDYPWTASVWYHQMLTITPNVNLVTNIGFGNNSTHTKDADSPLSNIPVKSIGNVVHPIYIKRNVAADIYAFKKVFDGKKYEFPMIILTFLKMVIRFLKRVVKNEY